MEHSPEHEQQQPRDEPPLRIGPWLSNPRGSTTPPSRPAQRALPAAPVVRESRSSQVPPAAVRQSTVITVERAHRGDGRRSHRLMLAGVTAAVLGLLLTVLWPATQPPPVTGADGPAGWLGPSPVGLSPESARSLPGVAASPSAASSVGGVSSSRPERPGHISAPARLPSPSVTASRTAPAPSPSRSSARPTPSPSRPGRPPKTTPPAQLPQLSPLPGWRERHLRSVSGGAETSIEFVNLRSRPVVLYWLDHHGQRRQYAVIPPSASHRQHTYVGHPWVVTDRRGRALACYEPIRTPARAEIR